MNNQRSVNDMLIRLMQLRKTSAMLDSNQLDLSDHHRDLAVESIGTELAHTLRMLKLELDNS